MGKESGRDFSSIVYHFQQGPLKKSITEQSLYTSDSSVLVSFDSDLRLFLSPQLQQQCLSRELFLTPPGVDVCQRFGVVAQIQQRPQQHILHAPGARLLEMKDRNTDASGLLKVLEIWSCTYLCVTYLEEVK